jgi:hypothetical protein
MKALLTADLRQYVGLTHKQQADVLDEIDALRVQLEAARHRANSDDLALQAAHAEVARLKAFPELEIQQRMMRLCQNVADKDLSSQDYTLRTMMIAWLVTSGWCEPDEAQRVRDLRAAFDPLLMAAEGVLACTPRDMPKAYGLLSSAIVKVRGAKP